MPAPSGTPTPPPGGIDATIRRIIALVITLVWAVGIVADATSKDFELSPFVYLTMLGLATTIYGTDFAKGMKG